MLARERMNKNELREEYERKVREKLREARMILEDGVSISEVFRVFKAQILAWKAENVSTYEISRRTGRGESSIRCLIVAARDLPPNTVSLRKKCCGRPKKTCKTTDRLLKRKVMKDPRITANELKIKHRLLLGEVAEWTIQDRLQKDLNMPTCWHVEVKKDCNLRRSIKTGQ